MTEDKVAPEVAEQEFARFLEAMDLTEKIQAKTKDADERKEFESKKLIIMQAMRRGLLVIEENGDAVFTPQLGTGGPIRFSEPTGAAVKATDQAKTNAVSEKGLILMSQATGQVQQRFVQMKRRDFVVCEALTVLLFLN